MFDPSSLPEVAILYRKWGKDKASAYFDKLGKSGNLQIRRGRDIHRITSDRKTTPHGPR